MLFIFILIKALLLALIAYAAGAALALVGWAVGFIVRIRIPAFLRWGAAGVLVLVYVFWINPRMFSEADVSDEAWRDLAHGTNVVCMVLAAAALIITGLVISFVKVTVIAGTRAVSQALDDPPVPPPLPDSTSQTPPSLPPTS